MSEDQTHHEKRTLRRGLKAALRALPQKVREDGASRAASLVSLCQSRTGLFLSMPDEINTAFLDDALRAARIDRAYPVFDERGLRFVAVPHEVVGRDLPRDRFGIPTPPSDWPAAGDLRTLVVPGLAFDARGGRLGRGKGLYDRFLLDNADIDSIGLFFDEQELELCPMGPGDAYLRRVFHPRRGLRMVSPVLKDRGG